MRGTQHQVENTATTKEDLEDGYPFEGVLQSDPVFRGLEQEKLL